MSEERARILNMVASGKLTVEEAEQLLDALGDKSGAAAPSEQTGEAVARKTLPKYLRVKVVSTDGDNVNVRVPLGLVRAGMKLTSLIPPQAMAKINSSMAEQGLSFDLNSLKPEDIDALLEGLSDMEVNVDSKSGDNVRVYCE
ncbi:MAG: hypothetical protein GF331_21515 [Chitinivibrionales bacterium]|nr:hypothetical protein [Chitinivibrionales bacterium]